MKKLYILLMFLVLLCSCNDSTNIFSGDILQYKTEVSKEEWIEKKSEMIKSSDVIKQEVNRDLSSIDHSYNKVVNKNDNSISDSFDTVINVSYDADRKILATVYNNDFSTRYCSLIKDNKLYEIKIVNLEIVEEKFNTYFTELTLANKAKMNLNRRLDEPLILQEEYYYSISHDIITKYYIDSNRLTLTLNYEGDVKLNAVFQYTFHKKYVCLNYKTEYENDLIIETNTLTSYILLEEVEIAPIDI